MSTKNEVFMTATQEYFSDPQKISCVKTVNDLLKIEGEILEIVYAKFDEHNIECAKDEKWKKPDSLNHRQISDVMHKLFHIHKVRVCSGNKGGNKEVLMVYVDELVLSCCGIEKDSDEYHKRYGVYSNDEKIFNSIISTLNACAEPRVFVATMHSLETSATTVCRCENENYAPMKNGIYDRGIHDIIPFSPEIVITTKAAVAYNKNAKPKIFTNPDGSTWDWDSNLKEISCGDTQVEETLRQIGTCILFPLRNLRKSVFMYAESGCNGKGTCLEAWRNMVGEENCCSIPVANFQENFMTEPLLHSQCVLTDENNNEYVKAAGNFKAAVTGDPFLLNIKNRSPVTFQFRGFIVQAFNHEIRVADKTDSFWRRIIFLDMHAKLKGKENVLIKDVYLKDTELLEYIAKQSLELDFDSLTEPESSKKILEEVKMTNDPVRSFWNDVKDEIENWNLLPFTFLYDAYKSWFKANSPSGTMIGKTTFTSDLLNVIADDDVWYCDDKRKKIAVTKSNMSGPEHLIAEYSLTDWMSKTYKGSEWTKRCIPVLSQNYTGLQRKVSAGADNE